ncbi:MAG TPA: L,D-transpeptidase family protein [Mycobacteriales bacterium]|nr:L,D-transpeptidase family protein [Mycobacteriales bacterium]
MKLRLLVGLMAAALLGAGAAPAATAPARHPSGHALPTRLKGVHDATQVISVVAAGYGSTTATVRAFAKRNGTWHQVFGPWSAWIGQAGFAAPGAKREGDGRTPSGSYRISYFFGVDPNPGGLHFRWRHAHSYDYWDDDSSSPRYNEWVNTRRHPAGRSPEPLHVTPSYRDVAVIDYNAARTPGRGSAIFLHVTHHSATHGCVALPRPEVIRLLRWLRPSHHPRIIMGTADTVTR